MRNFKETDVFSDTSSSCSQFESSFIGKHNNFFKKENENSKKSEKIVERTPISDSDSSTYKGKMSLVDMTYEKFIEQKRSSKKTLKTTELEERIKELQRDISFNKDNKQKDYSIKKKKNSSFEGKICEKYKEIVTFKESSIKKDKGFVNQEALFQELEDMK